MIENYAASIPKDLIAVEVFQIEQQVCSAQKLLDASMIIKVI